MVTPTVELWSTCSPGAVPCTVEKSWPLHFNIVMTPEVDFLNFGISTNDELMARINSCLNEIHALGIESLTGRRKVVWGGCELP